MSAGQSLTILFPIRATIDWGLKFLISFKQIYVFVDYT